ncbi:hypothetical protein JD844_028580 [Phrynosoma platyrhinos]|uniref:Uncharacterized protein n=1 Tax=Phrynosoma platyrhinos TaxID=52577 RepID=A0ABQ7SI66_PHRPL|nr:hypothetical protein JD844_028580 [Phrynosoma platyrhinos]
MGSYFLNFTKIPVLHILFNPYSLSIYLHCYYNLSQPVNLQILQIKITHFEGKQVLRNWNSASCSLILLFPILPYL